MKVKAYKVTGAHSHCDEVYYKVWPDFAIESAFDDVVDVGDKVTVSVEVVEVDRGWLDNLPDANDM